MTNKKIRLAFAGTPELARVVLEAIIHDKTHDILQVYTQPDRPAGRGRKIKQSEVKRCALEHNIPVLQPDNADDLDPENLKACDLMLVVAYGLLLKPNILQTPKFGCINIHTSLLPRWRGAAPIQRAIEAGDEETGISVMQMDKGLDTGPIFKQIHCSISAKETGGSLHDHLAYLAADSINSIITDITTQKISSVSQDDSLACYANKISKQEAELDWQQPAFLLERKIRAFNPFPVAYAQLGNTKVRIWDASIINETHDLRPGSTLYDKSSLKVVTGDGTLEIKKLQLAGKKILPVKEFLNGHADIFGT